MAIIPAQGVPLVFPLTLQGPLAYKQYRAQNDNHAMLGLDAPILAVLGITLLILSLLLADGLKQIGRKRRQRQRRENAKHKHWGYT